MSTTLRLLTLRVLKKLGVKKFCTQSSIRYPFVCHIGDFLSENPFYNRDTSVNELILMAEWCKQFENPVVIDVGGHTGFISTQLAQLLFSKNPSIYSFEPVPKTFFKLQESIRMLGLDIYVYPFCCALSDKAGLVQLTYSDWNSMLAQVVFGKSNPRISNELVWANALTLDSVICGIGKQPRLIKIDVEGHELSVLKGGKEVLSKDDRPALQFEFNPTTLRETKVNIDELNKCLSGYEFFFVEDVDNVQNLPFKLGDPIKDLNTINSVINIFAVPKHEEMKQKWSCAVANTKKNYRFIA